MSSHPTTQNSFRWLHRNPVFDDGGTKRRQRTFCGMGPREEDNVMLLLVLVSLICATLAGALEPGQDRPAVAAAPTVVANDALVRVVLPFSPNTTPSQR